MQKLLIPVMITFLLIETTIADNVSTSYVDTEPPKPRLLSLHVDPISLLIGSLHLNLKGRVKPDLSLFIDGRYTFPLLTTRGYEGGGGVHMYFNDSLFWGLVVKKGKSETVIEPTGEDEHEYHIRSSYISAGVHWGKTFTVWRKFSCLYRLGLCYPFSTKLTWENNLKPAGYRLMEWSSRLDSYVDAEVSVRIPLPL